MSFKIGVAGRPISTPKPGVVAGIERVKELALSANELEFVRKVFLTEEKAKEVKEAAQANNVELTCHGEYWISLNSEDPDKREASVQRVLNAARIANIAGATSVTFHPAYYGGMPPDAVYKIVKAQLQEVLAILKKEKNPIRVSPETTGKKSAFGTWEELVDLANELGCSVCFDFSHIWARDEGKTDFAEIIRYAQAELGKKFTKDMHIHLSGIEYTKAGERNHLLFSQSKFPLKEVLSTLVDFGCGGIIICESPNLEGDALVIQKLLKQMT